MYYTIARKSLDVNHVNIFQNSGEYSMDAKPFPTKIIPAIPTSYG